jgi:hypothetical protein
VLGREVVEDGEVVPVAVQRLGRLVLAALMEPEGELVAADFAGGARRGRPDLGELAARLGPEALGQPIEDVEGAVVPAALVTVSPIGQNQPAAIRSNPASRVG